MKTEIGLGTKLRHLTALLDGAVQKMYDEVAPGFRPRFFPIVQRLDGGSASIGSLAAAVGVSQPAITQTIAEMKRGGLVDVRSGEDSRTRIVALSEAGRRQSQALQPLWERIAAAAERLEEEVPGGLSRAIDEAIQALTRQPFDQRIAASQSKKEKT